MNAKVLVLECENVIIHSVLGFSVGFIQAVFQIIIVIIRGKDLDIGVGVDCDLRL